MSLSLISAVCQRRASTFHRFNATILRKTLSNGRIHRLSTVFVSSTCLSLTVHERSYLIFVERSATGMMTD